MNSKNHRRWAVWVFVLCCLPRGLAMKPGTSMDQPGQGASKHLARPASLSFRMIQVQPLSLTGGKPIAQISRVHNRVISGGGGIKKNLLSEKQETSYCSLG